MAMTPEIIVEESSYLIRKKLYPSESEVENLTWFGSLGDRGYNPCHIDTGNIHMILYPGNILS